MRNRAILQIFRKLPPKVQLGVGVLAVIAFGVMWVTGNLPQDGAGGSFVNNQDRGARQSEATRRSEPRKQAQASRRTQGAAIDGGDGNYDYLTMAMSWSPTYCETTGRARNDPQCSGERPYAFVLHGIWPQFQKGWPENCSTGGKPWVPNDVIRSMLDIMPSRGLIIHEYKKHGTCTGLDAAGYFSLSRKLYGAIKIPPRYVRPAQPIRTSPREIENEFLKANPGLNADMISVVCGRQDRLKELRICFSRDGQLTRCGRNENQRKLCSRDQIRVPPVRTRRRS